MGILWILTAALAVIYCVAQDRNLLEKEFWETWGETGRAKWGDLRIWSPERRYEHCVQFHKEAYGEKVPEIQGKPDMLFTTLSVTFLTKLSKQLGFFGKQIHNVQVLFCDMGSLTFKNPKDRLKNPTSYFVTMKKSTNCLLQISFMANEIMKKVYFLTNEICWPVVTTSPTIEEESGDDEEDVKSLDNMVKELIQNMEETIGEETQPNIQQLKKIVKEREQIEEEKAFTKDEATPAAKVVEMEVVTKEIKYEEKPHTDFKYEHDQEVQINKNIKIEDENEKLEVTNSKRIDDKTSEDKDLKTVVNDGKLENKDFEKVEDKKLEDKEIKSIGDKKLMDKYLQPDVEKSEHKDLKAAVNDEKLKGKDQRTTDNQCEKYNEDQRETVYLSEKSKLPTPILFGDSDSSSSRSSLDFDTFGIADHILNLTEDEESDVEGHYKSN